MDNAAGAAPIAGSCPACDAQLERSEPVWDGLDDRLFRATRDVFALRRCGACEVLFLWPPPSEEALPGYYPEGYWGDPEPDGGGLRARLLERYRRLVLRDHVRFVARIVEQQRARGLSPRLLDIGAGDGSFLDALGVRPATSLDASRDATRVAQQRGLDAVRGSLTPAAFRAGAFSLITMFHFLEHVAPPERYLGIVRELLRPDGDLVVQVPNAASWQARWLGKRWAGLDVPRHLIDYSSRSLARTLERSGFEIVRESHFSLRDNPTTLANSLAPGLYPPARASRSGGAEDRGAWLANLAYLGLTSLAQPFTLLEAACGRGAAVMVHARPRRSGGEG